MTEYKTMRVPADDWEAADDAKRDGETWGEYIQRCSNNPPEVRKFVEASDADGLAYDDVVAATRKAIRDELPTERM